MSIPNLIETNTKLFLFNNLRNCHEYRVNIYYYILNISVFFLFIIIVYFTLSYCSNKKLTPYEEKQKMLRDQNLILSKIRYFKEEQKANEDSNYTNIMNLPLPK